MANERKWGPVAPKLITADGGQFGLIQVDCSGFKVKQLVTLKSNSLPQTQYQVKAVLNKNQMIVGLVSNKVGKDQGTNLTQWLVADAAEIGAVEQQKSVIPDKDHYEAIYEQEPTVADRVVMVDEFGEIYSDENPLPIAFDGTISVGRVIVEGENGNTIEPNADGSINVNSSNLPAVVDTNYGVVGNSTLRTAAQIGNATGAADFGSGLTTLQTLRVASNLYDSVGNGITSTLMGGKQALDINIANDTFQFDVGVVDQESFAYGVGIEQPIGGVYNDVGAGLVAGTTGAARITEFRALHTNLRNSAGLELDYNFGTSSAATLRVAALLGNSLGQIDYGDGASTAQTVRTSSNIKLDGLSPDTNYGVVSAQTLRTASQIGNATGAADFNIGATTAQTLRVSANLANNGAELDYNAGISDVNTLRVAANLKKEGAELDYDFGAASVLSLRTASLIGNATGAADFNVGVAGPQTLRTISNLYDSAGNGLTSTLFGGKQALDVNIANSSFQINTGVVDRATFTYGTSIEQPVGGVFQDTGPTLTAGQTGAVRLTSQRAFHVNLRNASGTELDYNFGTASAATIRSAALIGNATGAADFAAGAVTAQTLRTASNTHDGLGNAITSAATTASGVTSRLLNVQTPDTSTATTALGALAANVQISMAGLNSVGFQIDAGTLIGTIVAEASVNNGTSWVIVPFYDPANASVLTSITFSVANTLRILSIIPIGGASHVRVRVSAYTSGTANSLLRASLVTGAAGAVTAAAYGIATNTFVAIAANTATLLLAANVNRKYAYFGNNTALATLRVQMGSPTGLAANTGIPVANGNLHELKGDNLFTGNVYGFSGSAMTVSVSEGTP